MKRTMIAFLLLVCGYTQAQIPTASLVGFYPFSGNANDAGGNNLHGTANSTTLTTDRFGNPSSAYMFNGSTSYINLPAASYTTLNIYSYSIWIKQNLAHQAIPICFGESSYGYCQAISIHSTGVVFASAYNSGGNPIQSYLTSSTTVSPGQWTHIVMTRNFSVVTLYINGVAATYSSTANTNGQNAGYGNNLPIKAYIGARTLNNNYFNGAIDDVRIYSTVLTQTAVTALFNENCFQTFPQTSYSTCTGSGVTMSAVPGPSNSISWYSSPTSSTAIANGTVYTTPSFSSSGTYTYYVAANSCTAYARTPVVVNVHASPLVSLSGGSICQGDNFVLSPSGAATYSYLNGGPIVSPLTTQNFSVTGTSSQGCLSSNTAVATVNVLQSPTVTVNSGSICSGSLFTFNPSGATSYTFPANSQVVSPVSTNTYIITGALANGCTASAVSSVQVLALPNVGITSSGAICNGENASLSASGASSYLWNTGATSQSISVAPASTTVYSVTGTSTNGCSKTVSISVTVHPKPVVSVNSGSICSGNSFTMVPSGAASYTFSSGSNIVSPQSTNNYSVYGTSSFGCLSSNTAVSTVVVNTTPTITVSNGFVCAGESFTLQPSGASSYTYSGGSQIVSPTANSTYTITGSNGNGCYGTAVANVAVVANPNVLIGGPSNICAGNSATLVASGATFYSWNTGTSSSVIVVSPSTNTVYSVTGANILGCTGTASIALNVNPYPVISVNSGSVCSGKSFTLIPTGAATYTYSGGSNVVSPLSTTNYSVTGTSAQGCPASNTAVANVSVISSPTISAAGGTICAGQSFTLSPSGGISYTYSGGSAIVSPPSNTNYIVTGANAAGCTGSVAAGITVNALTSVSIIAPASVCSGSTATLSATGATSYSWSTGGTGPMIQVSPSTQTTYSVTGTNTNGCVKTATRSLSIDPLPVIAVNSGSICAGKSFTMVPSGAVSYTYSSGSNIVSPPVSTSYSVTGTSNKGCVSASPAISSVVVHALPAVAVNSGSVCAGNSFTMIPSGAVSYTYSGGSAVVTPPSNASYTVTGVSIQGCTASAVSAVTVAPLPPVNIASVPAICRGSSTNITASGAASYSWNTGATSPGIVVTPSVNTTFTVHGFSAAGCSKTATVLVTVNPLPTVSVNSGSICAGKSFTMVPTGASTYTFSSGTAVVSPLVNSSYSVTGSSLQGCVSQNTAIANVGVISPPVVSVNNGTICAGSSFTMAPTGAVNYTYSSGTAVVSPGANTNYTITGASAAGCTASAISSVVVNPLPTISISSTSICAGGVGSMTVSPTQPGITYTWMPGNLTSSVITISPLVSTVYSLTAQTSLGCSKQFTTNYIVGANPTVSAAASNTAICQLSSATISATGANSYTLLPTNQTFTGTTLNANVTPTASSVYTVIGRSGMGDGCSDSRTVAIGVNPLPTITIAAGTPTICPSACTTLSATGAQSYSFQGGSSLVCNPGTYSAVGISAQGCVSMPATVTIVVDVAPVFTVASATICPGETATLTANGTAANFSWSTGSGSASTAVTPLVVGTHIYTVTAHNVPNCAYSKTAAVVVEAFPVISSTSGSICPGDTFTISASGANNYSISGSSFVVSPSVTTSYSVFGSSLAGCTSTAPAISTVSVMPAPQFSISGPAALCVGSPGTFTATGASSYSWSTGGTNSVTTVTPSSSTNYQVTGFSADGCAASQMFSVVVNPLPNVSLVGGAICPGFSFTFAPTGAASYTYLPAGPVITPSATGNYTVTGTDSNGCVSLPAIATVSVVNVLTISISGSQQVCAGNSATLTASGASNYSWSIGQSGNTVTVTPTSGTTYSVLGGSGSCSSTAVHHVSVNPLPVVTVKSGSICMGSQFNLSPAGAQTYSITGGSAQVSPTTTSSYSVTGTDNKGCTSLPVIATVQVKAVPAIVVSSSEMEICAGDEVTLNAIGANTYTWSIGGNGSSVVHSPSVNTTYSVTGTNAEGCKSSTTLTVKVDDCSGLSDTGAQVASFQIYPNPSDGQIMIATEAISAELLISDTKGALVYKAQISENTHLLKVSELCRGVYFCRLQKEGRVIAVKKLIITN